MTLDFNHRPTTSDQFNKALEAHYKPQPRTRNYLGASVLGGECNRAVQLDYAGAVPDDPTGIRTQRIFDRGHWGESYMLALLRRSWFGILDKDQPTGKQFGFTDIGGKFRGHCDGKIYANPPEFPMGVSNEHQAIWENKVVGVKTFKELQKNRLQVARPIYYTQIMMYQGYLNCTEAPALFTALNADTMEIHAELVPFDAAVAQASIDRAAMIVNSTDHHELLPRISEDQSSYLCRFCNFKGTCKGDVLP